MSIPTPPMPPRAEDHDKNLKVLAQDMVATLEGVPGYRLAITDRRIVLIAKAYLAKTEGFRTRVGDSLEVLDAIREALKDGPKETILDLVNGYMDRARADLATLFASSERGATQRHPTDEQSLSACFDHHAVACKVCKDEDWLCGAQHSRENAKNATEVLGPFGGSHYAWPTGAATPPPAKHPLVDGYLDTQRAIATGRYECIVNGVPDKNDERLFLRDLVSKPFDAVTAIEFMALWSIASKAVAASSAIEDTGDWQCRDYGDGWITFPTRKAAEKYQQDTGAMMRYRRFYPPVALSDGGTA